MSLKCMIAKWLHKGQISQEEYDAVIKKLDGHNKQIWNDAIEEFYNKLRDLKLQIKAHIEIENVYEQLKEQKNEV